MPLRILVRPAAHDPDGAPSALTFDGSRVVLGRGAGCDVRLPDPSVSHRHASVRASGADYTLVDEGSTNGTFVGEVKLAPHTPRALRSGDLVRLGRVWLEMRFVQAPATRDLAAATRDLALALVADAMRAMGDDVLTRVRVVEGPDHGRMLPLRDEGRAYIIGRAEACDLPLEDADASREHALLVRRGAAVLVRDLGSKNGVWMGASRVPSERDIPWRPQLMMRIGATVLALEEPVAAALAELEEAADEPIPPDSPIPPPPESTKETPQAPSAVAPTTTAAAPIAKVEDGRQEGRWVSARAASAQQRWSGTDIAVVVAAVCVIAASAAGLYWLLHGQ